VCSSDPTFTVVLDPLEVNQAESFNYSWILNGTEISKNPTLVVSAPGTYTVTLTKTDGTGCSRSKDVFVNASELANITPDDVSIEDISDNNSVTIKNPMGLGLGNYWFSLESTDGQILYPYQNEPVFNNVRAGFYTLYVEDKDGCGTASLPISVIGYPRFFTPNNDGYNDFWQIQGVNAFFQVNSSIQIFDRYGKLLKQLNPASPGWDGTFNGSMLATDDYWFKVLLEDGKTFMGHFTLKR
jgi:gliding motility-associated-like protein